MGRQQSASGEVRIIQPKTSRKAKKIQVKPVKPDIKLDALQNHEAAIFEKG